MGGNADHRWVEPACDFLHGILREDGGLPFALPSALDYAHAPWVSADPASSLTQSAANAAALHRLGVSHQALERLDRFCWSAIENLDFGATPNPSLAYDLRFSIAFLDQVPDATRAEPALERLIAAARAGGVLRPHPAEFGPEAGEESSTALSCSPTPGLRSRAYLDRDQIEAELDRLAAGQAADGGWDFSWAAWNPAGAHEWRGIVTLNSLICLRDNGHIDRR